MSRPMPQPLTYPHIFLFTCFVEGSYSIYPNSPVVMLLPSPIAYKRIGTAETLFSLVGIAGGLLSEPSANVHC